MTDKLNKVKIRLIEFGYLDNEWLDKYLKLIEANLKTTRDRKSTQAHHAIPVNSYWQSDEPYDRQVALKLARADLDNFAVNLLYSDHLLAHAYLTLCTNLDATQKHYEAQADLRMQNSKAGNAAWLKKHKTETINKNHAATDYLQKFYSEEEAAEINNL